MSQVSEPSLRHFGVRGMRWGVRKDRHPDYTDNQIRKDQEVYGNRGAKRINKALNFGNSISTARSVEKTRRDTVMGKNKYYRQGGKVAGALAGVAIANLALSGISKATQTATGRRLMERMFAKSAGSKRALVAAKYAFQVQELISNPAVRVTVSAGAAKVGTMLAGDAGVTVNMRSHGYNPNRKK